MLFFLCDCELLICANAIICRFQQTMNEVSFLVIKTALNAPLFLPVLFQEYTFSTAFQINIVLIKESLRSDYHDLRCSAKKFIDLASMFILICVVILTC